MKLQLYITWTHFLLSIKLTPYSDRNHPGITIIHLHIGNGDEVSWFLQAVEPSVFHELSHNLVGNLIAPLIDDRHVDVINKDGHLLASRWSIYAANALVHIALNGPLKIRQAETTQII